MMANACQTSMIHPIHTKNTHNCEHRSNSPIAHGIINPGGGIFAGIHPSNANAIVQSVIYNGRLLNLTSVESIVAHVPIMNREWIKRRITKKKKKKDRNMEQLVQLSTLRLGNFLTRRRSAVEPVRMVSKGIKWYALTYVPPSHPSVVVVPSTDVVDASVSLPRGSGCTWPHGRLLGG